MEILQIKLRFRSDFSKNCTTFDFVESTLAFPNFVRLPVAFRENTQIIWYFTHLFVPLHPISEITHHCNEYIL